MTTKRMNNVEYKVKLDELEFSNSETASVPMFGDSPYLPIAPAIKMAEAFGNMTIDGMHIGRRDIPVTRRVIHGGQNAKCYFDSANHATDKATGNRVATGTIQTSWFALPTRETQKNLVHDNIHTIGGINNIYGEILDVSGKGAHKKGTFAANALYFFTEESLYTPEEVKDDPKLGQNDTWTIKPEWEFTPAMQRKIDAFNWDESVFNVDVVPMNAPEPATDRIKSEKVGCKKHHWDLETVVKEDEQWAYTRREIDPMPRCEHPDHKQKCLMVTKPAK